MTTQIEFLKWPETMFQTNILEKYGPRTHIELIDIPPTTIFSPINHAPWLLLTFTNKSIRISKSVSILILNSRIYANINFSMKARVQQVYRSCQRWLISTSWGESSSKKNPFGYSGSFRFFYRREKKVFKNLKFRKMILKWI